jgi:hypothetical protein
VYVAVGSSGCMIGKATPLILTRLCIFKGKTVALKLWT